MSQPEVSIIIPTKNGARDIEKCLSGICKQNTVYVYEIIIIDSGSTDSTIDIVSKFPTRLIKIKPEEFGHGKTRNFGAKLANGKYLIYLTQDAEPANEQWLQSLVDNLKYDTQVAGAYSRWLPRANCKPNEAAYILIQFNLNKEVRQLTDSLLPGDIRKLALFSNVSSCIRKSVWQSIPFDDNIIFGEDQDWSKKALMSGYKIVYEPESVVYHSYNYSLITRFRKSFDSALGGQLLNDASSFPTIFRFPVQDARQFWGFMKQQRIPLFKRIGWLAYTAIMNRIALIARFLGKHHKYIPNRIKMKLSTVPHITQDVIRRK